jgi:protein required for attachment to host cells
MITPQIPTWVVVADSAKALFFALESEDGARSLKQAAETMTSHIQRHSADLKSDKPGRSFASAGGGVRHAIEPHRDYHKLEKHEFARAIVQFLEKSFDAHAFERFVLVAPERSLGEMRKLLPRKMQGCLWNEVPHDFTKLDAAEIWLRISPQLKEHVRPAE